MTIRMCITAVGSEAVRAELALDLGVLLLALGALDTLGELLALDLVQFIQVAPCWLQFVCLVDKEWFAVRVAHVHPHLLPIHVHLLLLPFQ